MKNLKVGIKLGLGFGLVLLLMLALVVLGLKGMADINERLDGIVNDNNVKVDLASEMRGAVRNMSVAVRNVVLLSDPA
ncbi:MAG TPA: MCP four helix bundle domain-containing protein, partial [Gallionella sp.]|nr:MCP four helix bundle domain-containing protein [Gallionella sp.]